MNPFHPERLWRLHQLWNESMHNRRILDSILPRDDKDVYKRCVHLGEVVDNRGCNCVHRWVHACTVHEKCTITEPTEGAVCCVVCKEYEASDVSLVETALGRQPPRNAVPVHRVDRGLCLHGKPTANICLACAARHLEEAPFPMSEAERYEWASWDNVRYAHTLAVEKALSEQTPEIKHDAFPVDRGIVIPAGGINYFTQGWIAASVLRHVGCSLPIEFWYLGPREMDDKMIALAESKGVKCVDALAVARALPKPPRILAGWELKPFAILHSRFKEVMLLDADNVVTRDPSYLFDDPAYRQHGAIFWPDLPPPGRDEWVPPGAWESVGLPYINTPAFESGQILIDKEKCWQALNLCQWINEHSDRYYQVVYGDKDTFLLAWHRAGKSYALAPTCHASAVAILQHDMEGRLTFQHRCVGANKFRFRGQNKRTGFFHHQDVCFAALDDLRSRWRGRIWDFDARDGGSEIPGLYEYHRIGIGSRPLELLPEGRIGLGGAAMEERWSLRTIDGTPRLIIHGANKVTMFLTKHDGDWLGKWEEHEQNEVKLRRQP